MPAPPEDPAKKAAAPRASYGRPARPTEVSFKPYQPTYTQADLREIDVKLGQDFKNAQALIYGDHLLNDFSRQVCTFIAKQDLGDAEDLQRVVRSTRKAKDSNQQTDANADQLSIEEARELINMFMLDFKYVLKLYAYYDVMRFKAAAERAKESTEPESRETTIYHDAQTLG